MFVALGSSPHDRLSEMSDMGSVPGGEIAAMKARMWYRPSAGMDEEDASGDQLSEENKRLQEEMCRQYHEAHGHVPFVMCKD